MAMSVFAHFVVDVAVKHKAAVTHAREIGTGENRAGLLELTRLNCVLIDRLHLLQTLVERHGAKAIFEPRDLPMTAEEKAMLLP